jgi:hypothetical protein
MESPERNSGLFYLRLFIPLNSPPDNYRVYSKGEECFSIYLVTIDIKVSLAKPRDGEI